MHHSDVSSMLRGTIICCFCIVSTSSLRGSWGAYDNLLKAPGIAVCNPLTVS